MITEYMELACTELINTARAVAYAELYCLPVQCDACPDLACALDDEYVDPETDDAPWFDEAVPESANVLGFMGMSVTGFSDSTFGRTPIPLVGDGSALGIGRRAHRLIKYTVLMIVRDECAMSYGLEWLTAALINGCCDSGCTGDTLSVYSCCPECDGCDALRYLYDVALFEGPTVESTEYITDGILVTISYTLIAGTPWIYRDPIPGTDEWVNLSAGTQVTLDPDDVFDGCTDATSCLEDPDCPSPRLPTRVPIPVDTCYPSGSDTFLRTIIGVPPADVPNVLDLVPVIELETGSAVLRRLIIRFRASLTGANCTDPQDPCSVCADVAIPYLPENALLTIDGRVQRAEVECIREPLGSTFARPTLYGQEGGAFTWPVFQCPGGLCIEIYSELANTAPDARVRVMLVSRSDAG